MKKVFCFLCHQVTNPLIYSVNYLSSFEENIILIHVDAKSCIEDFQFLQAHNVFFVQNRVEVTWGSYSQIASTLNVFSEALNTDFEYLFLLSGDDLPCQTNQSINEFLSSIQKRNLIHFQDERNSYINPVSRVKFKHPNVCFARNKNFVKKAKVLSFRIFKHFYITTAFKNHSHKIATFHKGTNWLSLNHQTVSALVDFINTNPWYCDLYHHSFCGDEVFFHTAIKHLEIEDNYHAPQKMNDALRYIDWKSGPDFPRILDEDDMHKIKMSGCLFARKIPHNVSHGFFNELLRSHEVIENYLL